MRVMQPCKDLDPNMPDDLQQMWLTKGLPPDLQDIVLFSPKGVSVSEIEESLKELEMFLTMTGEVPKETPKEK